MNTQTNTANALELSMKDVRNHTAAYYQQVYEQAMRGNPDANQNEKKILTLLYRRQTEALDLLDGIRTRVEEIPAGQNNTRKISLFRRFGRFLFRKWISLVTSLYTRLVLCALILTGAILSAFIPLVWIAPLVCSALLFFLLTLDLVKKKREEPAKPEYTSRAYMMHAAQAGFAEKMSKTFESDTHTILQLFQNVNLNSDNRTREFAAEMYQKIYRASCENPRLRSLLDRAETILWAYGLEAIPYSPETAACYDVQEEECPSQTLYPAVCRKADRVPIRKGEYCRNIDEI